MGSSGCRFAATFISLHSSRRIGDYIPPEEKQLLEKEADKDDAEQKSSNHDPEKGDELNEDESTSEEDSEESPPKKMKVLEGKAEGAKLKDEEIKTQNEEEYGLRVMMIKNKHKRLYKSMMENRKKRSKESKFLE